MNATATLLNEMIGFAAADGVYPITRAEMYRACIMFGETPKEADASAFAPFIRPLADNAPGRVAVNAPITAERAVALAN